MDQLGEKALFWTDALTPIRTCWTAGDISDAEAASLYLLVSLQFWFPDNWLGGPDPLESNPAPASISIHPWLTLNQRTREKLPPNISVAGLIHGFSFKAIRRDARSALSRWQRGEISLKLTDQIPSPLEVLNAQVAGGRWVTALFGRDELGRLVHDGRDALSFLLHDLGHAEKFFGRDFYPEAQIGCYRLLQKALLAGKFDLLHELDPMWEERLHYLIADLNSHPVHILSVFWGTARDVFRKHLSEVEFERWQQEVYELWEWDILAQTAYRDVLRSHCEEAAVVVNQRLVHVAAKPAPQSRP